MKESLTKASKIIKKRKRTTKRDSVSAYGLYLYQFTSNDCRKIAIVHRFSAVMH